MLFTPKNQRNTDLTEVCGSSVPVAENGMMSSKRQDDTAEAPDRTNTPRRTQSQPGDPAEGGEEET